MSTPEELGFAFQQTQTPWWATTSNYISTRERALKLAVAYAENRSYSTKETLDAAQLFYEFLRKGDV